MATTVRDTKLEIACDDSQDRFYVKYTNKGDPFREGIDIGIDNPDYDKSVRVMLRTCEAEQLRDFLIGMYPIK